MTAFLNPAILESLPFYWEIECVLTKISTGFLQRQRVFPLWNRFRFAIPIKWHRSMANLLVGNGSNSIIQEFRKFVNPFSGFY